MCLAIPLSLSHAPALFWCAIRSRSLGSQEHTAPPEPLRSLIPIPLAIQLRPLSRRPYRSASSVATAARALIAAGPSVGARRSLSCQPLHRSVMQRTRSCNGRLMAFMLALCAGLAIAAGGALSPLSALSSAELLSLPLSASRSSMDLALQPSAHQLRLQQDRSGSELDLFSRGSLSLDSERQWSSTSQADFAAAVTDPATALMDEIRRAIVSVIRPFAPVWFRETLRLVAKLPPKQRAEAMRMLMRLALKMRPMLKAESLEEEENEAEVSMRSSLLHRSVVA